MDRGIVVPITVRVNYGGTYKLIDGLKRIVCQEALGFKTIPALIIGTERENG
jgi:ParB-like chromosome segregation protein Spo0J